MTNEYLVIALGIFILTLILLRAMRRVSQAKHLMEREYVSPENVQHPDVMARTAIAEAFNSGKMVFGSRDENGNITMTVVDKDGNETKQNFTEENNE